MNRELHKERLATTDEKGKRIFLFPEEVKGKFRNLRTLISWFLIPLFLGLPWINIDGKQSILLNILKREFTFFGTTFYGHDTPLLFFVLIIIVFFIGGVTAIFGRVWCGWACPQTVFIDAVYRKIEEMIEGNARKRKELAKAPWGPVKFFKRFLKWTIFIAISIHLAHSFLGYFIPIRDLFLVTTSPPWENPNAFIFMMIASAVMLFNFAWFREQFCIIACPYGRFQSVMMDKNSLVIGYDYKRGEPRRGQVKRKEDEGDCINCFKCVRVCPTGIDIRRGTQLECIACTACIDACDEIMDKTNRPRGLIRYTSEEIIAKKQWVFFRPRPLLYFSILIIALLLFINILNNQTDLSVVYVHGRGIPEQVIKDQNGNEIIVHHFNAEMSWRPQTSTAADFKIFPEWVEKAQIISAKRPFILKHGKNTIGFFIRFFSKQIPKKHFIFPLDIANENNKILNHQEIKIVLP